MVCGLPASLVIDGRFFSFGVLTVTHLSISNFVYFCTETKHTYIWVTKP